jgi:hypothetical protein
LNVLTLPKLYSEREAAATLGVSTDTMQRERARGKMPFRRIGGRIKYTSIDLENYINRAGENQCVSVAATTSPSGQTATPGAVAGSTQTLGKQGMRLSALPTEPKPKCGSPAGLWSMVPRETNGPLTPLSTPS